MKISILVKMEKISILVKMFEKSRFWSIFMKISIYIKIDEKSRFLVNIFGKISILVNIFGENWIGTKFSPHLGFSQNFGKVSIWVKICKYLDFDKKKKNPKISIWSKFSKI